MFFIDIEMPEMSGTEMAARIAGRYDTLLIAMTAHEPSIEPRLLEAGFDACLFKPFNTDRLCATLQTATGIELDGGKTAAGKLMLTAAGAPMKTATAMNAAQTRHLTPRETTTAARPEARLQAVTEFAAGDNEACRRDSFELHDRDRRPHGHARQGQGWAPTAPP